MKTDTDKTESQGKPASAKAVEDRLAFFESLIAASNCNETANVYCQVFSRYSDWHDGRRKDMTLPYMAQFAVDLIDYLEEAHPENALTALAVARRILKQLSK